MARTLKVGQTYPHIEGMASDSTGAAVDLSSAESLELIGISGTHVIGGAATPIWPPIADPDGAHFWNWEYTQDDSDVSVAGEYSIYLKVTWATDEIEYFPDDGSETLTIQAVS